jgi:hypothetical protein
MLWIRDSSLKIALYNFNNAPFIFSVKSAGEECVEDVSVIILQECLGFLRDIFTSFVQIDGRFEAPVILEISKVEAQNYVLEEKKSDLAFVEEKIERAAATLEELLRAASEKSGDIHGIAEKIDILRQERARVQVES